MLEFILGAGIAFLAVLLLGALASSDFAKQLWGPDSAQGTVIMQFHIQAGQEVYNHQPLAEGLRCKVVVQGIDDYHHSSGPGQGWSTAKLDAVYLLGDGKYVRHESLLFDSRLAVLFEEDPYNHRYSFIYTGTGRQVSILLRIPEPHKSQHTWPLANKPLQVTIRTLTAAEEVEVKAREKEQEREEAEMQREELNRRALELATLAFVENNFLSPEFQQNYAAKHTAKILNTLSSEWRAEYLALMSNKELYDLVQTEHRHVLEFFLARFEVSRIAQRLAVEPTPPPPAPEPKSRLTPEEWQARIERYRQRSLTRKRVKVEDYKADVMQDLELLQEFIADLDNYPLDEDERERLINEFKERLLGGEEEGSNGYRQL
jgi:hypothetical protein